MGIPKKKDGDFTYGDYLTWNDEKRCEIFDGKIYMMTAPTIEHQFILGEIYRQFANYLVGKPCKVFPAPFDVRLTEGNESDIDSKNVVQPDITIVCDNKKLSGTGCFGTPDLIIEILSKSTSRIDMRKKFKLYEKSGVKEYWIVHPYEKWITVYILKNEEYIVEGTYFQEHKIKVNLFGGLEIDLETVFE